MITLHSANPPFHVSMIIRIMACVAKIKILAKWTTSYCQMRGFASSVMKSMDINSKYKMLSGYEIPISGYGVS